MLGERKENEERIGLNGYAASLTLCIPNVFGMVPDASEMLGLQTVCCTSYFFLIQDPFYVNTESKHIYT
jgi:hypothetical protein